VQHLRRGHRPHQGSGATVGYGYDNAGNQTSITCPGQTTSVIQTFDDAERLKTVTDWNSNQTVFGYDSDGLVKTTQYPNGTAVTNGYNDSDQLTSTNAVAGGKTLVSATFGRDPMGQVGSQTVGPVSQTIGYTAREQLQSAGTATQTFNAAGQLCWTLPAGSVANPACGAAPAGATTYTFDTLGERETAGATTYSYDQASRLTASGNGSTSATYVYDGDGLRTSKTVGAATGTFGWNDASLPNALSDGANTFLYGPGGLPIEQVNGVGSFRFVHDQIGSTLALLNSLSTVVQSYTYTPYGQVTSSGTVATPLQYAGQYTDSESGLIYLRARYYDPVTMQFLTVDPLVDATR
jgi:RHS repeat-associated protein